MYKVLALAALLATSAVVQAVPSGSGLGTVAANGLSFQANANVTALNAASYKYRQCIGGAISDQILNTYNLAYFINSAVSGSSASASGSAKYDASVFAGFAGTMGGPPFSATLLYEATATASQVGISGSGASATFSASASASLMFIAYTKVEILNADGSVVSTINLSNAGFNFGSALSAVHSAATADGSAHLYYATLASSSAHVSFTFAVSEVLGVLSIGGATLTPKSLETVFETNGLTVGATQHIRLTLLAGSAAVAADASGSYTYDSSASTVVHGTGAAAAYLRLSPSAIISGTSTSSVTITRTAAALTDLTTASAFLAGIINGDATVKASVDVSKITVDFPAGAGTVTYDPSSGFEPPNSAARIVPALALLLAAVAAFFHL